MFLFATQTPQLLANFDISGLFQYAQVIIDALMPVIYVTLGIALGFVVIQALKNAFS